MKRGPDGRWTATVVLPAGSFLEYKVTRGSWLNVQMDSTNNDIPNFTLNVVRDTLISVPIIMWRDERRSLARLRADSTGLPVETQFRWKWRYRRGDDLGWADPAYDDSSWEAADPLLVAGQVPKSGWFGIGWFRLHMAVDSALLGKPLALWISQMGASEVYVDGKRAYTFGKVGHNKDEEQRHEDRNPQLLVLGPSPEHLIAIRYSSFSGEPYWQQNYPIGFSNIGFSMAIGDLNRGIAERADSLKDELISRTILCSIHEDSY
jgi:hypothetical protein